MRELLLLVLLLLASPPILFVNGFLPQPPKSAGILPTTTTVEPLMLLSQQRSSNHWWSVCFMGKGKKRPMEEMFDEDLASAPSTNTVRKNKKKKRKTPRKTKSSDAADVGVSPLLSQWAAAAASTTTTSSKSDDDDETDDMMEEETTKIVEEPETDEVDDDDTTMFVAFEPSSKKSNSKRRVRQSERLVQEQKMQKRILKLVEDLEDILENQKGSSEPILAQVKKLIEVESPPSGLRQLVTSKNKLDYRLAWVGSDEALCHIGTGLHKVPLARMQEVFLTFQGGNELQVLEVISILGPFPNVRNTLQGDCKDMKAAGSGAFTEWTVQWESMIDGTGKEILAGEEIRKVPLQVYFSDKNALVAVVPNDDGSVSDPFAENGKNVIVFVREEDLDGKLSKNRVL